MLQTFQCVAFSIRLTSKKPNVVRPVSNVVLLSSIAHAVPNSIDRINSTLARQQLDLVSNVVLLPCRTQFVNYKCIRIHLKVCRTVSLSLCSVFDNSHSIRLNYIRRLKPSLGSVVLQSNYTRASLERQQHDV